VSETTNLTEARVAVARKSLKKARDHLDDAMSTLPERQGDNTMATPALLALLLHAVAARRHLTDLETALADEIGLAAPPSASASVAAPRDPWP
jgi:DNA-binding phage protein